MQLSALSFGPMLTDLFSRWQSERKGAYGGHLTTLPKDAGRGLHSSTFQLNLSPFRHRIHNEHRLVPPDTSYTPLTEPLHAPPIPQKALTLS